MWCIVEDTVDQSNVGSWPTVPSCVSSSAAVVRSPAAGTAALPAVDNLTIDNMDELPDIAESSDNVSQLSKTLIEFLLTRSVSACYYLSHCYSIAWDRL